MIAIDFLAFLLAFLLDKLERLSQESFFNLA
jgi:hypothetical protein